MIDGFIDLICFLITISEIHHGSVSFSVLLFLVQAVEVGGIHAYLHILFYKVKRLRDYNIDLLLPCTYTQQYFCIILNYIL